jgi:putative holliday junction resolvase
MPLYPTLLEFKSACPKGRLIGIDAGSKTFGLAMCDETRLIASPFHTIQRKKWSGDSVILMGFFKEFSVQGAVVGWPLNMNGSQGPRCQATQDFVNNFLKIADLSCFLWDERLSTVAITRTLLEADLSRQKREKAVDKLAATYILQGFINGLRNAPNPDLKL